MDSVVMQILAWALPSGFLSSVVAWLVTRRQRNNDFLASLQKSIDLLTEKYTETLDENVRLQADNAHLLANQKVMEEKIDALNKKIDQLTKQLKTQNEKSNSGNSPRSAPRRSADGGVRSNQEHDERADGLVGAEQLRRAARSAGRRRSRHASACAAADADGLDDDTPGVCGTGSGGADGHDDSDAEPP
jgi:TolA-binding protein